MLTLRQIKTAAKKVMKASVVSQYMEEECSSEELECIKSGDILGLARILFKEEGEIKPGAYTPILTYLLSLRERGVPLMILSLDGQGKLHLRGSYFSKRNFTGAVFPYADFSHSDLSYTNFSNSNLIYADFSGSDLSHANFSNAELYCALFYRTNLSYADFSNANLCFSFFDPCDKKETNLQGIRCEIPAAKE